MKTTLTILLLALTLTGYSQDRFSLAAITSPGAYNDGLNIGVELTAEMYWGYVSPQYFIFPDLNNNTYAHLIAGLGINVIQGKEIRPYTGLLLGTIFRFKQPHPTWGGEIGVDWRPHRSGVVLGLKATYQRRTDYVNNPFWRENVYLKIGFEL